MDSDSSGEPAFLVIRSHFHAYDLRILGRLGDEKNMIAVTGGSSCAT